MKNFICPPPPRRICNNILFLLFLISSTYSIAQTVGTFGVLSPHTAATSDPDSMLFDRFGNSYDLFPVNGSFSTPSEVRICGYYELRIDAQSTFTDPELDVVCMVFDDLSVLIDRRTNTNACGETYVPADIVIEIGELDDLEHLVAASGTYQRSNNKCDEMLSNRVYRKINGGKDLGDNALDGKLDINRSPQWYLGASSAVPAGFFDLYSAVMTESMHLLGMESFYFKNFNEELYVSRWDHHLHRVDNYDQTTPPSYAIPLISSDCESNCWNRDGNITQISTLGIRGCSHPDDDLVFGETAIAPLSGGFFPNGVMEQREMMSHLDDACNNPLLNYVNQLTLNTGVARRMVSTVEQEILCELGYKIANCDGCAVVAHQEHYIIPDPYENHYELNCCYNEFYACRDKPLVVPFTELLCNDKIVSSNVTITDAFVRPEFSGSVEITPDGELIVTAGSNIRVYYTVKNNDQAVNCDCFMDNTYFEVRTGPCDPCVDPCQNLSCYDDFEEHNLGTIFVSSDEYFIYNGTVDFINNSPDICFDNTVNKFLQIGSHYPNFGYNGEALLIPLQKPINPGCTMNLEMRISKGDVNTTLNIFGSTETPCKPSQSFINFGCNSMTTDCGDHIYDPICLEWQANITNLSVGAALCPGDPNFAVMQFPWTNNTNSPINYIVLTPTNPATAFIDNSFVYFDDILITRDCGEFDPNFDAIIDGCEVTFIPVNTSEDLEHFWDFGDNMGMSSSLVSPKYTYTGNDSYDVTHTITDECGNKFEVTKEIHIDNCNEHVCPCENGINVGMEDVTTSLRDISFPYVSPGKCISFAGTIIVDQPISFYLNEIHMDPNSEIIVKSGEYALSTYSTFNGCEEMWQGITVENDATFRITSSTISDAFIGVTAENETIFICHAVSFKNNNTGIFASGAVNLGASGINNSSFSGTGPGINIFQFTGNTGIELQNVPDFKVANNSSFTDLRNGVIADNSTLRITDSYFTDIYRPHGSNFRGVAIDVENSPYSNIENNGFNNCVTGISVSRSNIDIIDNQINHDNNDYSSRGIHLSTMTGMTADISLNIVNAHAIGLEMINSMQAGNINIEDNEFYGEFAPLWIWGSSSAVPANGIELIDNDLYIGGNNFNGGNPATLAYSKSISVYDNDFWPNPEVDGVGTLFQLVNTDNNQIRDNVFNGENITGLGMSVGSSGGNLFCCNETKESATGIFFAADCGDSHLKMTTFGTHETAALRYRSDAATGPQIRYGNDWSNSSDLDAWHNSSVIDFIGFSRYEVLDMPNNIIPMPTGSSDDWFIEIEGEELSCENPADCGDDLWSLGGPTESDLQVANYLLDNIAVYEAISWSEKIRLLYKIRRQPTLFEDEVYLSFVEHLESEIVQLADVNLSVNAAHHDASFLEDRSYLSFEIQDIIQQLQNLEGDIESENSTDSLLIEGQRLPLLNELKHLNSWSTRLNEVSTNALDADLNVALTELSTIEVSSNFGQSYKKVHELYLTYLLSEGSLSTEQMNELLEEATRCHEGYGKGVLIARDLHDLLSQEIYPWYEYDESCSNNQRKAIEERVSTVNELRVQPNPVSSTFTIEAMTKSVKPDELTIFNASGIQVINQTWDGQKINIGTHEWSNGVYFIEWKSDEEVIRKKMIKQ